MRYRCIGGGGRRGRQGGGDAQLARETGVVLVVGVRVLVVCIAPLLLVPTGGRGALRPAVQTRRGSWAVPRGCNAICCAVGSAGAASGRGRGRCGPLVGGLVDEDGDSALESLSEADRCSDDDEMEPLRDDWRRCEGLSGWAVVVFMLVCRLPSRQECVSQAKPAVNAMRMQAWLPQAGTRWGRRR